MVVAAIHTQIHNLMADDLIMVAPFVKSMAELFAYTLLDRLPVVIDQIVKQDSKRAARVTLSS